jgi:hypothetical protein
MERFGYPDFVLATADELIEKQYANRTHLRDNSYTQLIHGNEVKPLNGRCYKTRRSSTQLFSTGRLGLRLFEPPRFAL